MNTALLNAAARIFFILAFFGVLPDNMKHQTFEIIHLSVNTGKLENPVQIAVLSDLHMHEYGPDNADLVNAVRGEQPDIITIIGDMVNKKEDEYSLVLTLCRQLTEIAPVYYVYGNHEYDNITKLKSKMSEDLTATGVNVLESEWRTIEVNGNLIDIGGLSRNPRQYNWTDVLMMQSYLQSPNFRLLLVHDPGFFDPRYTTNPDKTLIGKDIDIALCGHRHGGQIDIPYVGGVYMPDVGFFPELTSGDNFVGKTHVIVSRGLGDHNIIPRVNNPYELLSLTIQ
ncbi:MAG: metallophosphoesterase [Anaerolineaceae bacterium]|nr:metallophosphoesterase [Anaerolineaceae bacterium]